MDVGGSTGREPGRGSPALSKGHKSAARARSEVHALFALHAEAKGHSMELLIVMAVAGVISLLVIDTIGDI